MQLRDEIKGLEKENEYLTDRLKEETESNYLQSESIAPAINITADTINVTIYPESFLKEG